MTLKEFLNQSLDSLFESINDKPLFKAIITAGPSGGGKSFVTKNMFSTNKWFNTPDNVTVINSDILFELGLDKANLSKKILQDNKDLFAAQTAIRNRAKELTHKKLGHVINGMGSLLIDGTGADFEKTKRQIEGLKSLGYDVSMVFINTPLELAQKRNARRERSLDPKLISFLHKAVSNNLPKYKQLMGNDLYIIDNKEIEKGSEEEKAFKENLFKLGQKILNKPLQNPIGKSVIETLRNTGGKYLTDLPDNKQP